MHKMEMFSKLLFILLTICFMVVCEQITVEAVGTHLESTQETVTEEIPAPTETIDYWNDMGVVGSSTAVNWKDEISESLDDDIIELNVGGEKISTLRSTLTAVPKSKLAKMLMKNNESELHLRDKAAIKRNPEMPAYAVEFQAPNVDLKANFTAMLTDLGLNPEAYLWPIHGVHRYLNTNSLIGWQECYRSTYDTPFDLLSFRISCRSTKLLVACRPTYNRNMLSLAGVGNSIDRLDKCPPKKHCLLQANTFLGFYNRLQIAWGFEGRPEDSRSNFYFLSGLDDDGNPKTLVDYIPCDRSDEYSEYRLCWSLRSSVHRGGGDRCGSMTDLHNNAYWERIVYQPI
ncbi:unnamed protein product [Rotaria socialis]|uniref:Potassium channel tetramerisation-type BTB domain-containing protein n=2 Tax=Rotaria socialis TaxID=392032 RepID=A0A820GCA3_9BILA|nr:unnamed protein product [Rotaria socialis]